MPAAGGGGRGNAGKSTKSARRKQRRAASPTTSRPRPKGKQYAPRSPGSDAAQRPGAQTQKKAEARNRGRSDAAAPGGAAGYRQTPSEKAAVKENIRQVRARARARARGGAGWRFLEGRATAPYRSARDAINRLEEQIEATERNVRAEKKRGGSGRSAFFKGSATIAAGQAFPGLAGPPKRLLTGAATAVVTEPKKTGKATLKGGRDIALGLVPGIIDAVTDPAGAAEGTLADYVRRYGPAFKEGGEKELTKRFVEEGLAAELLDATIAGKGPGRLVSKNVKREAERGRLGAGAKETATAPRRRKRTSLAGSEAQPLDAGFFKASKQKRKDEAAFRGQRRTVERADREAARNPRADGRTPKRGEVDAVVREATERGEVVPSRIAGLERRGKATVGLRRAPSQRKINRAGARRQAGRKGRLLHSQRRVQRQEGLTGGARGAGANYARLDAAEQRAFKTAVQLQPKSPAAAKAAIEARIRRITAEVQAGRVDAADARELPVLQAMVDSPEAHFTPKLLAIAREEKARGERMAERDPGLGDTVAERRATAGQRVRAPQALIVGVKRRGTPVRAAEKRARRKQREARAEKQAARTDLQRAERRAGKAAGRTGLIVEQTTRKLERRIETGRRVVSQHERAAANHRARASKARGEKMRESHERRAEAAEDRAAAARKRLTKLEGDLGATRTRLERKVSKANAQAGMARDAVKRAEADQRAAAKEERQLRQARRAGRELVDAESPEAFNARVDAAARERGLDAPGFFPSTKRETVRRSLFTSGGSSATKRDRRYRGRLFVTGREDGSFTTYAQGLARNTKREHNWRLITESTEAEALRMGDGPETTVRGTVGELQDLIDDRGYGDSVVLWNPGIFKEAQRGAARTDDGERTGGFEEGDAEIHAAVQAAALKGEQKAPAGYETSRDWVLVPKAVYDEIMADTKPSGFVGRGLDVVKGKQARILLGTSPAWLQMQIASNTLLTSLAGVGPMEIVRARRWWNGLSDAEKAAVEPYVGIGHFHDSLEQVKIGAASNARLVNGWRAMKEHPFWHKPRRAPGADRGVAVSQLNPLDALFRVDNAQNNLFRQAVLYNRVKRDAYERMGAEMGRQQRLLDRVMRHFEAPPREQMQAVLRDRGALERHAQSVNDFLGDYMTYTAKERRYLGRSIMFYGFLRFSLRFTFYTMPTKHPVTAAIVGQLGRMETEEVRKLLGGDELPWALGRFYFERGGKLKSINVARANPALNQLTDMPWEKGIRAPLLGALRQLPPVYVSLINVAMAKSSFRDRPYATGGRSATSSAREGYTDGQLGRVFAGEMLRLSAIYRAAENAAAGGKKMGDDSLLLSERPTEYKDPAFRASVQQNVDRHPGAATGILRDFVPFIPRDDFSPEIAAKVRQTKAERAPKKPAPGSGDPEVDALIEAHQGAAAPTDAELDALIDAYAP